MVLCDDFAIISSCSHSIMNAKHKTVTPGPQRAADTLYREGINKMYASVVVKVSDAVFLFAEDNTEFFLTYVKHVACIQPMIS